MHAGEEGSRLSQMAPALEEKSASDRQAGEVCTASCSSSEKALEASFAADMTVQNH